MGIRDGTQREVLENPGLADKLIESRACVDGIQQAIFTYRRSCRRLIQACAIPMANVLIDEQRRARDDNR